MSRLRNVERSRPRRCGVRQLRREWGTKHGTIQRVAILKSASPPSSFFAVV
jgi:hypothetical protein